MNDWTLFCELSLVAMVVMFVVWFAVVSALWKPTDEKHHEGAGPAGTKGSLAAPCDRLGRHVK